MTYIAPQTTLATALQFEEWRDMAGLSLGGNIEAALRYATVDVTSFCQRTFVQSPVDGVADEVRTFPSSGRETLSIDDCLEVAGVSVNGGALVATGYLPKGVAGKLPYTYLVRKALAPYLIAEYAEVLPWLGLGIWPEGYDVAITGLWGYAAAVPDDVVEVTCMLAAARLMGNRDLNTAGIVGTTVLNVTVRLSGSGTQSYHDRALARLKGYQRWD